APLRRYGEFLDRDAPLVMGQYQSSGHYPLDDEHREDPMSAWLMEPDAGIAETLKRGLLEGIRLRVDAFLGPQGNRADLAGAIDLGRMLRPFMHMYDILAPHLQFTPEERRYFRAAVAFLCYKIESPHYWNADAIVLHSDHPQSPHRTAWFPSRDADWCTYNLDTAPHNFHIDLYTAMGSAAAIFPGHPCSRRWLDRAVSYVERELDNWIFTNGAYIESATYTLGTLGWWIPFFAVLKNARVKNYFLDERFQRLGYALARMLGPFDRRIQRHSFTVMGDAMYPSGYGNTLAWMAGLGREDPTFSATMMAAWQQTGCQLNAPGQQGQSFYDAIFLDPNLPAEPLKDLPSEHLDGLGLILRDSHGTPDEVYFFLKCGKIYSHFHYDEGAFFVFADGVPLLDEYGIQYGSGTDENGQRVPGNAPRCHNAISFSGTPTDRECYNRGYVTRFISQAYADYAVCEMPVHLLYMKPELSLWGFQGEEAPYGWWRRHILFVKPYGFFFYDQLESEFTATLDLNFKADTYRTVADLHRVYRGRYGTDIPVCVNFPTDRAIRDGRIDMHATASSFPKFSTMASVAQEIKDNFYHQVSMHVETGPNTDFSWAFAWSQPEAQAMLRPLRGGAPGSILERADGVTRAIIAPAFKPAVSLQQDGMRYAGWAGAVTERPGGAMELIQMAGKVIGASAGMQLHGDGPFRAVMHGQQATIEIDGRARWLEVHGVNIRRQVLNGREVETEPASDNGARRIAVPAGPQQLMVEWEE
ncbi:MAG TPA: heparinase II/III family protein, partial [Armatimonadota bacterium]|nr:heparinase II/III family protein [Armatimonadota bacterium]